MGEEGLESERVEKFLPSTVLRVLLVEVDDSTRQIIAALLRKCNYKVSAVSDGLKAWQILKGKQHNIDLVLTEVELPYISGFKLLTLIMEHDVCKNIPVIMMSSHHSISMVLKCTLKGAADFLIKPVRKNELRNLWQHVWRRQTLTGGYIPPNLTATQQKVEAGTDDNTGSNHLSDYAVSSCIERDSSGKGNDAQVHAQPKCKTASYLSNNDMEKQEESAKTPQGSTIQESETEENPSNFGSNVDGPYNGPYKSIALKLGEEHDCGKATNHYESMGSESTENGNIESEGSGNIRESDEPMSGAIDFIGTFDNRSMCSHVHSSSTNGSSSKFECMELPLRRFYKTDERSTLDLSNAFTISWYNNSGKTLHSFFPTVADTCIELEESTDRIQDFLSSDHSEDTNSNSQKGVTMGNNKENTTILNDCAKSEFWSAFSPKPAFQQEKSPSLDANTKVNNLKQYQRSDEIWNNCDNLIVKEEKSSEARDDVTGQSCSGSSSLCNDAATQFSSNGYGSISTRSDGVTATAIENSNDGGFRGFHSSEREAALMKFRLKRKDRCYDKKVRYQSRKRLAEQRPRVKGQFVRQVQTAIAGVGVGVGVGADA